MQLKIPFRLARGLAVAVFIVFAHFTIAWLFDHLKIPRPDLGPVFATLLGEIPADAKAPAKPDDDGSTPVQIVNDTGDSAPPR